jgi:hypothetical protein
MSDDRVLQEQHRMARDKAAVSRVLLDQLRDEVGPKWMEQSVNKARAAKEIEHARGFIEWLEKKYIRRISRLRKKMGMEPLPRGWRATARSIPNDAGRR